MVSQGVRGRVVTAAGVAEDAVVRIRGDVIEHVGPADVPTECHDLPRDAPLEVGLVLPGLVDLHCHGGGGASLSSADHDEVARAARHHLEHGTTSVVAGVVTDDPRAMLEGVAAAARACDAGTVLAIHVEGPFLSRSRCGAQDPDRLRLPDPALAAELLDAGRGHVRVMTLAPELAGGEALVELLLERGVVPAVGHTEADAGLVRRTLAATHAALGRPGSVTHLFNAMPPLHHRGPGPVAGALAAAAVGDALLELVADGVHLDEETVHTVFALLGQDRVLLVTDAMAAAGMPDGRYRLGPGQVSVTGGVARLAGDSDRPLAGGTAHLLEVVRRCVRSGLDLAAVVTAASRNPAAVLGLDDRCGALEAGRRADLVVTDDDLGLLGVMRAGEWVVAP